MRRSREFVAGPERSRTLELSRTSGVSFLIGAGGRGLDMRQPFCQRLARRRLGFGRDDCKERHAALDPSNYQTCSTSAILTGSTNAEHAVQSESQPGRGREYPPRTNSQRTPLRFRCSESRTPAWSSRCKARELGGDTATLERRMWALGAWLRQNRSATGSLARIFHATDCSYVVSLGARKTDDEWPLTAGRPLGRGATDPN
ncbi:MAG: hypothetical protein JWM63_5239 [Gammaproteobacteria bacterium]|nr:hypothetical protein [Gammaproteobacteria bacterium]